MMRGALWIALIVAPLACLADLSEVQSDPLCADPPPAWSAEQWAAIKVAGGAALLPDWERAARCHVYLLRAAGKRIATDEETDLELMKALAAQLTLKAARLRDHLEGLLDHNWQNPNPSCQPESERPVRRDSTAYASLCITGRDLSARLADLLTWMEEHAGFAASSNELGMLRAHAEHVLNCAQASEAIDWDNNDDPQQVCGGELNDYGLQGEGPGDFISAMVEQAENFVQP